MQPASSITSIGIPTRDRPDTVVCCLESYVANALQFNREPTFYIVDDSRQPDTASLTRQKIEAVANSHPLPTKFLDRTYRLHIADRLAEETRVPVEVTRYALLGDNRCDSSYGAARNTLLLATSGELSIQVDDDTICKIGDSTSSVQTLTVTNDTEPDQYVFFKTRKEAHDFAKVTPIDFLKIHEQLLGKHRHAEPLNSLSNNPFPDDFFVANTFLGACGDSGMRSSINRLFLQGRSFDRLTESEIAYNWQRYTRHICRAPNRPTLSTNRSTITINIGLDNREILPPFPPNLRYEDGVFGECLGICVPKGIKGYLPYSVMHDPENERIDKRNYVPQPGMNDLLAGLLSSFAPGIPSTDPVLNIPLLGTYLSELTLQSVDNFRGYTINVIRRMIKESIRLSSDILATSVHKPDFWIQDVQAFKLANEDVLKHAGPFTPIDLSGNVADRWELAKELMSQYAELLQAWPTLVKAAPACFEEFMP